MPKRSRAEVYIGPITAWRSWVWGTIWAESHQQTKFSKGGRSTVEEVRLQPTLVLITQPNRSTWGQAIPGQAWSLDTFADRWPQHPLLSHKEP